MTKVFLEMLAPAVQIAKTFFGSLHRWCKSQKLFWGRCTDGANRKNLFGAVAPAVQIAKTFLGPLHRRCKSQKPLLGRCTGGANRKNLFWAVAPAVQAFPKTLWPSHDFRRNSDCRLYSYIELTLYLTDTAPFQRNITQHTFNSKANRQQFIHSFTFAPHKPTNS